MDIHRALGREFTDDPGEELAEGHHHDQVRGGRVQGGEDVRVAEAMRLQERQAVPGRRQLHRGGANGVPTARRPVRLCDHQRDLVPLGQQVLQRGHGEGGTPHEHDAHKSPH